MTRSKLALVMFGVVLTGGLLIGRVAVSQKAAPAAATVTAKAPSNSPALEKAHKVIGQILEAGRWTAKDHDQVQVVFGPLHTEQKIEIIRKVAAAIDNKKLVVEKGARLF